MRVRVCMDLNCCVLRCSMCMCPKLRHSTHLLRHTDDACYHFSTHTPVSSQHLRAQRFACACSPAAFSRSTWQGPCAAGIWFARRFARRHWVPRVGADAFGWTADRGRHVPSQKFCPRCSFRVLEWLVRVLVRTHTGSTYIRVFVECPVEAGTEGKSPCKNKSLDYFE